MSNRTLAGSLIAILTLSGTFSVAPLVRAADETGTYQVAQVFKIGGKGGFDYITVDNQRKLLYVPRSTHTMVIDANRGRVVADIPGQQGNHGVAIARKAGRGFISDGKDGSVVIFDLKSNEVLGKIKTAEDADALVFDKASGKVFVSCGDAAALVPVPADADPKSGKADAAIDLGGKPEAVVTDGQGRVYVNLVDKNEVAVIDSRAMKVVAKYATAPGGKPVGLSIDRKQHRLFIGCRDPQKLVVMGAEDGHVLADLPIGAGCDATVFAGDAFASCRDGSLAIARETTPGKFEIVQNLKTRIGAKTVCVDAKTHTLYLPTAEFAPSTNGRGRNRPRPIPDSFMIVVVRRGG